MFCEHVFVNFKVQSTAAIKFVAQRTSTRKGVGPRPNLVVKDPPQARLRGAWCELSFYCQGLAAARGARCGTQAKIVFTFAFFAFVGLGVVENKFLKVWGT